MEPTPITEAELAHIAILRAKQNGEELDCTSTLSAILERCKSNLHLGAYDFARLMLGEKLRIKQALDQIADSGRDELESVESLGAKVDAVTNEISRIKNTASAIEIALEGYRDLCLEAVRAARALAIEVEDVAKQ